MNHFHNIFLLNIVLFLIILSANIFAKEKMLSHFIYAFDTLDNRILI